mmetsp:Transcript_24693/g.59583  ORF Transcript_24693/g.59583 Transcript_24693/m.59583 type:complete len:98 (-) Transcript_24693:249-542(-)
MPPRWVGGPLSLESVAVRNFGEDYVRMKAVKRRSTSEDVGDEGVVVEKADGRYKVTFRDDGGGQQRRRDGGGGRGKCSWPGLGCVHHHRRTTMMASH